VPFARSYGKPADTFGSGADGARRPRVDALRMNELIAERVAWRRRNVHHHYVGRLWGGEGVLRFVGREPGTGIEVSLSVPVREIDHVDLSHSPDEAIVGVPGVVLELADTEAIYLREIVPGGTTPQRLAHRLGRLLHPPLAATAF
jgi:hypothetical protein